MYVVYGVRTCVLTEGLCIIDFICFGGLFLVLIKIHQFSQLNNRIHPIHWNDIFFITIWFSISSPARKRGPNICVILLNEALHILYTYIPMQAVRFYNFECFWFYRIVCFLLLIRKLEKKTTKKTPNIYLWDKEKYDRTKKKRKTTENEKPTNSFTAKRLPNAKDGRTPEEIRKLIDR